MQHCSTAVVRKAYRARSWGSLFVVAPSALACFSPLLCFPPWTTSMLTGREVLCAYQHRRRNSRPYCARVRSLSGMCLFWFRSKLFQPFLYRCTSQIFVEVVYVCVAKVEICWRHETNGFAQGLTRIGIQNTQRTSLHGAVKISWLVSLFEWYPKLDSIRVVLAMCLRFG